jgi:hypothetical protein
MNFYVSATKLTFYLNLRKSSKTRKPLSEKGLRGTKEPISGPIAQLLSRPRGSETLEFLKIKDIFL